jgi:hypothetical protein
MIRPARPRGAVGDALTGGAWCTATTRVGSDDRRYTPGTVAPSRIFRKAALERMSSPEQLDLLLQVTTPRTWLALLSMVLCVLAAVAWGFWGELATKVTGRGTLAAVAGAGLEPSLEARVYVAVEHAAELRPGMEAEVVPAGARREEHGVLRGTVSFVAGSADTSSRAEGGVPSIEVRIQLQPDAGTASGYAWSTRLGAPIALRAGTPCVAEVVTERSRPVHLMVPALAARGGPR